MRMLKIQLMVLFTFLLINDRERLHQLVWVVALSIGFFGIKGGAFTIATGGSFRVWGPPGSFIEGNNEIALALIMVLPLMRFLQLHAKNKWVRRGLLLSIALCGAAIIASYSRGAFLALGVIVISMWWKGKNKLLLGSIGAVVLVIGLSFMPQSYFDRIGSIQNYEQDESTMGRFNAWQFAFNLAVDRPLTGGGFDTFTPQLFYRYAPNPTDFHDAHSIYCEILGELGFIGLFLFLGLWISAYLIAGKINRSCQPIEELAWARDLSSMLQVSILGYAAGGAFLGLAYFDLPYHILAMIAVLQGLVATELSKIKSESVGISPNSRSFSHVQTRPSLRKN